MIYLATPISHEDPKVEAFRIATANRAASILHDAGIPVFSPASHGGPIASLSAIRQSWSYWEKVDIPILTLCCTHLVVLCVEGWERSVGVQAEIEAAFDANLTLVYIALCACGSRLREHKHHDGPARPDMSIVVRLWEDRCNILAASKG